MKLNRTGSNWTELERNKINENWSIIEGRYNDVVGQITDEVVGHLIDSARLEWKEPVDTVEDLPTNAEVGETRMVREADPGGVSYVYRYDGEKWEKIQAIDVTLVNEVDRRLTAQLAETESKAEKARYYDGTQKLRGQLITKTNPNAISTVFSSVSPRRPLLTITYDDESSTIYDYAWPIHKEENAPGVFYVVPSRIGTGKKYNYSVADTWERLHEMNDAEVGRIEIQHHTNNHEALAGKGSNYLKNDIESANEIFLANGIVPRHLAYPYGSNDAFVRNFLQDYFESATTVENGVNGYDLHPFKMHRRGMDQAEMRYFEQAVDNAVDQNGWLITFQHEIHPSGYVDGDPVKGSCKTPDELRYMIQYAKSKGLEIVGLDEGMKTFAPYMYAFNESVEPTFAIQRDGMIVTDKRLRQADSIIRDRFNRPDNPRTLGTDEYGNAWTPVVGTWGTINANAYMSSISGATIGVVTINSLVSDFNLSVDLTVVKDLTDVVFRYAGGVDYWRLETRSDGYRVAKIDNGQSTIMGSTTDVVPKNGDKITIQCKAESIKILINGTERIKINDGTHSDATRHGMRTNSFEARFDNFYVIPR